MNKLWLVALGLGLSSASAVAQQPPQGNVQPRIAAVQAPPPAVQDVYTVCFHAGVPYSEGAEVQGKECTRSASGPTKPVTWENTTEHVFPLVWKDKPGFYK